MNDVAKAQIAEAEEALQARAVAERNGQPEYTLVRDPYMGVGIYTRVSGTRWSLEKVHDGDDVQGLAAALRETGAPVTVCTDVHDLAMQGYFEPIVDRFVVSPESVRSAARAAYLFREADRVEALWAAGDRWGDSGAAGCGVRRGMRWRV